MSLLDIQDFENKEVENETMWQEYDKLDADVNQNLLEIDAILATCQGSVGKYHNQDKSIMAVGAALIWWNLAIYILSTHSYLENKNRLMICWY